MPNLYRLGQIAKASARIGSVFKFDYNADGVADDVQEVSYEVIDVDNETEEVIVSVDCPEEVIDCDDMVIKRDGEATWSWFGDNLDIVRSAPNYPCTGTPSDCAHIYRVRNETHSALGIGIGLSFGFGDAAPAPLLVPLNSDSDTVEDDLVAIDKPLEGNVTVSISSGSSRGKLWNDSAKGSAYLSTYMPQTLYIEGLTVSQNPGDVTLQFSNTESQHSQKVTVFNVSFGSSEIRTRDEDLPTTTLPWATKSAALQWDGTSGTVNLSGYLTPVSKVARDGLRWTVNSIVQFDSILEYDTAFVIEPGVGSIYTYRVEAEHRPYRHLSDRFILVVYPEATATEYKNWVNTNQDLTWTNILPKVYNQLGTNSSDPEPDASCNRWDTRSSLSSNYHPGASYEMRTRALGNGNTQGHQATYDSAGSIIASGLGAGTADRVSPNVSLGEHGKKDVEPFIWAAQLDANPVEGVLFNAGLNHQLMHRGENLNKYLELRPIQATPSLAPDTCQ